MQLFPLVSAIVMQVAQSTAEGLTSADAIFHAIVGAIVAMLGIGRALDILRDFGIVPEKKNGNGKPYQLTQLQIMTVVQEQIRPMTEILRDIRDDIKVVADDTRQRQLADRIVRIDQHKK